MPESARDSAMPAAASGTSTPASSAKPSPTSSSSRTSEHSRAEASKLSCRTSIDWATRHVEVCLQPEIRTDMACPMSVLLMSDRGSGSWPTPTKSDYGSSQNGAARSKPSGGTPSISTRVRGWPTPVKIDAKDPEHPDPDERRQTMTDRVRARGWPTPVKGDWKDSARHTTTTGIMHPGTMMTDAVRLHRALLPTGHRDPTPTTHDGPSGSNATLVANPQFIEALQGAPAGWTDGDVKLESLAWEIRSLSQRPTGPSEDSSSLEDSLACGDLDEDEDDDDEEGGTR